MRKPGTYALDQLVSDVDGSEAFRVRDPDIAGSWDFATGDLDETITWEVDSDDLEADGDVSLSLDAYARLVARARAHCEGCSGACGR